MNKSEQKPLCFAKKCIFAVVVSFIPIPKQNQIKIQI